MNTTTQTPEQAIISLTEGYGFPAERIINMALNWNQFEGRGFVWESISYDQESAIAFYDSLDRYEALELAAEALVASGWTRRSICFRLS